MKSYTWRAAFGPSLREGVPDRLNSVAITVGLRHMPVRYSGTNLLLKTLMSKPVRLFHSRAPRSCTTIAALTLAAGALAQNSSTNLEENVPAQLPPVTVTAQKQPTELQNLPVSVTP